MSAYILSLETATERCSASITNTGVLLSSMTSKESNTHSRAIMSLVQQCLDDAGIEVSSLCAVAISDGPGSYTGLRVGAGTAKGLCYALDIPLIAVPTLQAIALPFANQGMPILSTLDARRMEFYGGLYDEHLLSMASAHNYIWSEGMIESLAKDYPMLILCGNGLQKALQQFSMPDGWNLKESVCHSDLIGLLADRLFREHRFVNTAYHVPYYFKSPNITKSSKGPLTL